MDIGQVVRFDTGDSRGFLWVTEKHSNNTVTGYLTDYAGRMLIGRTSKIYTTMDIACTKPKEQWLQDYKRTP